MANTFSSTKEATAEREVAKEKEQADGDR